MARNRQFMLLSVFIGCFFLASPLFAQSKSLKKIHVGVPAISMGNMIIFFTKEAKLFEKHGLDADVVVMSGSGISSRALVGGSVEISPIATPTVMLSVVAGSDMVILAHTMPGVIQSMMVRPEIKKDEDLKGKIIGVTTFGSLTDFLVRHLAKKKGMNPDKDLRCCKPAATPRDLSRSGKAKSMRRLFPIPHSFSPNEPGLFRCGTFSRRLTIRGVRLRRGARQYRRTVI